MVSMADYNDKVVVDVAPNTTANNARYEVDEVDEDATHESYHPAASLSPSTFLHQWTSPIVTAAANFGALTL